MIVSVYIGKEAGSTSGTRCETSLSLYSETTVRVLDGCTGRHLSVITSAKTSLSLCRVRVYGVCSGQFHNVNKYLLVVSFCRTMCLDQTSCYMLDCWITNTVIHRNHGELI